MLLTLTSACIFITEADLRPAPSDSASEDACDPAITPGDPDTLVEINAGSFTMGSPPAELGRGEDEAAHLVTLTHGFWLSEEVTVAAYLEYADFNPTLSTGCDDCPVEALTWHEAAAWTVALSEADDLPACYTCTADPARCTPIGNPYTCEGWRLPTEAEWEYSARAGSTAAIPSSATGGELLSAADAQSCESVTLSDCTALPSIAFYCANSDTQTSPVASLLPNPWGLHDMVGNVSEWVHDGYAPYDGDETDPVGDEGATTRVIRGGDWAQPPASSRSAWRYAMEPDQFESTVGFRIARTDF